MGKEEDMNKKSVWNDIKNIWGRIAGVIAAIGILATFLTKVLNTPPELTYGLFAALGVILLLISFYVDKQTEYTHQEIVEYERKARKDFKEIMDRERQQTYNMKEDSNQKINALANSIEKILEVSKQTRQDTVRIQLLMIMEHQPDNIDTILKLAETYFVELKGDWYMTSEFNKWAKAHDVMVPSSIYKAIDDNHKKE